MRGELDAGGALDNLTHALAGAALSRVGLDRTTPLATATLVLAANAPDVDVLAYARGEHFALAFRRGITHGLPALVLLPALVAGAVVAWDRGVRRRRRPDAPPARPGALLGLAWLGALTHPVLDWMNTYGMRWGLPFDGAWTYGDALFIVDPWLWLLLGAAAALGGPHGRRRAWGWSLLAVALSAVVLLAPVPPAARAAWVGLAALMAGIAALDSPGNVGGRRRMAGVLGGAALLYVGLMVVGARVAEADATEAARAAGLAPAEVMVAPVPADPLAGEVVVATAEAYVPGTYRWSDGGRVRLSPRGTVPRLALAPGVDAALGRRVAAAAREAREARWYLTWSRFPFVRVAPAGDGWSVAIGDARYAGRGAGGLAGLTVRLDAALAVVAVE